MRRAKVAQDRLQENVRYKVDMPTETTADK